MQPTDLAKPVLDVCWQETNLVLPPETTFERWLEVGFLLKKMNGAIMWWLGDWALFGCTRYGDRFAQAVDVHDLTGLPVETIRVAQWVSERVVNRLTTLSWTHHLKVASLEPETQDELLAWAVEHEVSAARLAAEVRRHKQQVKTRAARERLALVGSNGAPIVVCADALAAEWPGGALIIADPPYGLTKGAASGARDGKGRWDEWTYSDLHRFNGAWLVKAQEALDDEGSLLVFGTLHNTYSIGHQLKEMGAYIIREIVWVKPFVQRAIAPDALVPAHETILWARFGVRHRSNLFEITRDVWEVPTDAPYGHPTEKPEALLQRLVEMASDPGDTVLDLFSGSGTAAAVALRMGRRAWAVEQDAGWACIAEARCQQAIEHGQRPDGQRPVF